MSFVSKSIVDSIQRGLYYSEEGIIDFQECHKIIVPPRNTISDCNNLWKKYVLVDECSEFLDSISLPLDTPDFLKVGISSTLKSPLRSPRSRSSTGPTIIKTKKQIKKQKNTKKKKTEESPMNEIYITKPGDINKKTCHSNILIAPKSSIINNISKDNLSEEREKCLKEGIQLFNTKPSKGITHWIDNKFFNNKPDEIAKFLFTLEGLDKEKLGEYLSEENSFDILGEFVCLIDFEYMDFDLALRKYAFCFRMPGEAQKIDRCMKKFAAHYFSYPQSNDIFENEIAVYAMAFGTIMLNTDAHNIQVKNKMTEKQFIENTQYIKGGEMIPAHFLTDLYHRILDEEIMLDPSKSCFPSAIIKGWMFLHTRGNRWKQRWIILSHNNIYICKKPAEQSAIYGIVLDNCSLESCDDIKGKPCFSIILPSNNSNNESSDIQNYILFCTQSTKEYEKWQTVLKVKLKQ